MKLIDADELIDFLQSRPWTQNTASIVDVIVCTLKKWPGIEWPGIKFEPKWIPCTERLPDYDKDVLLTYAYDGSVFIGQRQQAIEYKTTGFRTFDKIYVDKWVVEYEGYTHDFNAVSAWAELPEGYKKGGGSE